MLQTNLGPSKIRYSANLRGFWNFCVILPKNTLIFLCKIYQNQPKSALFLMKLLNIFNGIWDLIKKKRKCNAKLGNHGNFIVESWKFIMESWKSDRIGDGNTVFTGQKNSWWSLWLKYWSHRRLQKFKLRKIFFCCSGFWMALNIPCQLFYTIKSILHTHVNLVIKINDYYCVRWLIMKIFWWMDVFAKLETTDSILVTT